MSPNRLLIFGLGYSGTAIGHAAATAGFEVAGTTRTGSNGTIPFDHAADFVQSATHLLTTAAPADGADPVLARYSQDILSAPNLRWIGYLSSTAVYGDRGGAWVDEDTPAAPSQGRGQRRLDAETAWTAAFAGRYAVDIFRLAGIYGPGRSALDELKTHRARRLIKPGHQFGRIHRDDIAHAVAAAMCQQPPPGLRVLNLADDEPAESAMVVAEAARLLHIDPPPDTLFADALPSMSPMARTFWAENRKVASQKTKAVLGISWLYPTYREGLRAILAEQRGQDLP
jgi:nucleoside-diphosphate-sugar epimerase